MLGVIELPFVLKVTVVHLPSPFHFLTDLGADSFLVSQVRLALRHLSHLLPCRLLSVVRLDHPQCLELLRCRGFQLFDPSFLLGVEDGANLGLDRLFESTFDLFVKRELTET